MTKEERKEIASIIVHRIPSLKCPMCGDNSFSLSDGYVFNSVHQDYRNRSVDETGIPSVLLICGKCGFISQHAIGALGLLKENKVEGNK